MLLGTANPSGRLPVTWPEEEEDVVSPCPWDSCAYSERLLVGWRALHGKPVAFPFGHGLSYTTFSYGWAGGALPATVHCSASSAGDGGGGGDVASPAAVTFTVRVTNAGATAGAEVVQLYLRFPPSAGEPPLVLRAFGKTKSLAAGESADITLDLWPRDFAVWSESAGGGWQLALGTFGVEVGASSRDLRLQHSFELRAV